MSEQDLKPLFQTWIVEEMEPLQAKGSQVYKAYKKAFENLRKTPQPVTTARELKNIPYIGEKIFAVLCARLQRHCEETVTAVPASFLNYMVTDTGKRRLDVDQDKPAKQRRKGRFFPRQRSGGWAILIALHRHRHRAGMTKDELVNVATEYCDASFTAAPGARDFYSAWSAMKTLEAHEYVSCRGRPKVYELTEEGLQIAKAIAQQEGFGEDDDAAEAADASFDNGVRVTPDASQRRGAAVSVPPSDPLLQRVGVRAADAPDASKKDAVTCRHVHDTVNKIFGSVRYDVWCAEDYEIVLLIDTREVRSQRERDYFPKRIAACGVVCESRALSVGDILWIARHKTTGAEAVLNYVCERKRLDDLAASIRDKRFHEQKARLENSGLANVYYLVEESGIADNRLVGQMRDALKTAMASVVTVSRFSLERFRRIDDTVEWLRCMSEVLARRYQGLRLILLKPDCFDTRDEYLRMLQDFRAEFEGGGRSYECVHKYSVHQAAMTKTTMMTVREMFIRMLLLIKGMTLEKATLLQSRFPVPRRLIEYFLEQGAGKTEHEKGVLMMDLFQDQHGSKKYTRAILRAIYDVWGRE